MDKPDMGKRENPLAELISDDIFELLKERGLFNEKSLRDYQIRKKYKSLREKNINSTDAIDILQGEYPYLQFDTIRKIVYRLQ